MDWSDEVRARLEAQAGVHDCSEDARVWAADIRAALAEIERLTEENASGQATFARLMRSDAAVYALLVQYFGSNLRGAQQGLHNGLSAVVNALRERAEAAEADLRVARAALVEVKRKQVAAEAEIERRGQVLREMRDILGGSDPEREDGECARCGESYNVRPGYEYSPECDPCAQTILGNARAALGGTP